MNCFSEKIELVRDLFLQHFPQEAVSRVVPGAAVALVAGIILCVIGAKLARIGVTAGFVLLGAALGHHLAQNTDYPAAVCIAAGAIMIGAVGFLSFRFLVGAAVAIVLSSIVLGAFGYERLLPHVAEFEQTRTALISTDSGAKFSVPAPSEQQAYLDRSPMQWGEAFWSFARSKEESLARNAHALAIATFMIGLFLGVVAVRWATIAATSVFGTALVVAGIATLLSTFSETFYQALLNHPMVGVVGTGVFLATSLVLQTMLTRKSPSEGESKPSLK